MEGLLDQLGQVGQHGAIRYHHVSASLPRGVLKLVLFIVCEGNDGNV
jgi:hypothetical protein